MKDIYKPRIILFDLETLPNLKEALKVWPQLSNYPGLTLRATITTIICGGWKVLGESKTHCINAWDFKSWNRDVNDDRLLVLALYDVLKDADAVVTHNGKRFDWKFFQTRLMVHGLDPLPKTPHIDTVEIAKRNLFSFNNRLGTLGEALVGDKKLENGGWELWVKVHGKDPKAMKLMERYCKQDVKLLEKLFLKLQPLTSSIPNHNLFSKGDISVCPSCGSKHLKSNGWRRTQTKTYKRLFCLDCHSWSRTNMRGEDPRAI